MKGEIFIMNRRFKRVIATVLTCGLLFTTGTGAFAQTKEEAQQKIEELQKEQAALNSRLAELQKNKADTESYIQQLDTEMTAVIEDIQEVNTRLDELAAQLEETERNLKEAEEKAEKQYEALKIRIKQMYEEGDPTLMEIILKAKDISTVLNSSEYISKISDYDNDLLAALNETLRQIEEYKAQLEQQKEEQEQVKAELEIRQQDLQAIIDQKNAELQSLGLDISDVYDNISDTESALAETQKILEAIKEQERKEAEEAERKRKEAEAAAAAAAAANKANNASQSTGNTSSGSTSSGSTSSSGSASSGSTSSSSTNFIWPCAGGYISSGYGGRTSPTAGASSNHKGVDIAAGAGTAIYAAQSGTVVTVSYHPARGNYIVVSHGNGVSTLYQHCSAIYASAGQTVSQGSTIAAVGSTGYSTGPHLHFEVLINGVNVNPSNYL